MSAHSIATESCSEMLAGQRVSQCLLSSQKARGVEGFWEVEPHAAVRLANRVFLPPPSTARLSQYTKMPRLQVVRNQWMTEMMVMARVKVCQYHQRAAIDVGGSLLSGNLANSSSTNLGLHDASLAEMRFWKVSDKTFPHARKHVDPGW